MQEEKTCPRCKQQFLCHATAIENCFCNSVLLTEAERNFIAAYEGCLCRECLTEKRNKEEDLSSRFLFLPIRFFQ
jgi:hypothetical protein